MTGTIAVHLCFGYAAVVPGSTKRGYTSWYLTSFLWSGGGYFRKSLEAEHGLFLAEGEKVVSVERLSEDGRRLKPREVVARRAVDDPHRARPEQIDDEVAVDQGHDDRPSVVDRRQRIGWSTRRGRL